MIKSNAGRKTKYSKKYAKEIYNLKRQSYTDVGICEHWGISQDTFYRWKKKYSEFSESYKRGVEDSYPDLKDEALSSLRKMVRGYDYKEVHKIAQVDGRVSKKDAERKDPSKLPLNVMKVKEVKKHVPPNMTAILATLYYTDSEKFARNPSPDMGMNMNIIGTKYTRINKKE